MDRPDVRLQHREADFQLFPLLPPELRLRIWDLNLGSRRLVSLRCGTASPSLYEKPSRRATGCTSDAPVPVNLHVCAESRAEALKSYAFAFAFAGAPGRVIFNPDTDILSFGPCDGYMAAYSQFCTCVALCNRAELARVRHVAISDALFWVHGAYDSMTAASLTVEAINKLAERMPLLDRIVFVARVEDEAADLPAAMERISRQVQTALASVCKQVPLWRPPRWDIVSASALSTMGG